MTLRARFFAFLLAGLLVGGAANVLFGASPETMAAIAPVAETWAPDGMRLPDLAVADVTWRTRAPRGAAPVVIAEVAAPPPPPIPVGIVGIGRARQAIFLADGKDFRGGVGARLPDGGRILAISGMMVNWVDGAGKRHSRRMFIDPMQLSE